MAEFHMTRGGQIWLARVQRALETIAESSVRIADKLESEATPNKSGLSSVLQDIVDHIPSDDVERADEIRRSIYELEAGNAGE